MNFLYPAFLIGAALIAIPIALHLLRRDVAPEVRFTAVRLLKKSPIEQTDRRRLRDLLLLAARVAALLLLAAAFARPYFEGGTASGALRVIAIDRSYSMGAPGQFDRAVARARAAIDDAGAERVALIAFDERADVLASGSAGDARAALQDIRPGYGATRYGPVLMKAAELADGAPGRLVIVTDLQRAGWEEQARGVLPAGFELQIEDAGPPPPNVAVTSVRSEPERLVVSVRNTDSKGRTGELRATREGRTIATGRFSAAADTTMDVEIPFRAPSAGSIVVSVDDPSGYIADNSRFLVLDTASRPVALIVTSAGDARGGFYLARAIDAAAGGGEGFEPRIVTGAQLAAMPAGELAANRVIVLLSTRGIDRRAREPLSAFVKGGGGLLVAASPDVEASVLSMMLDWQPALVPAEQALTAVSLSATDLRHPIFRPFGPLTANLGHVRFDRSWRIREEQWMVAARFTDGAPALLERAEGNGRVVLFTSDVDRRWNDFPLHPSFVPFALETLRHAAGTHGETREYTVARVPDGVRAEPGVYRVQERVVSVNVDPRESSTARMTAEEFDGMIQRVDRQADGAADQRAIQAEARQGYWRYAVLLMLGVLVVESFVGKV